LEKKLEKSSKKHANEKKTRALKSITRNADEGKDMATKKRTMTGRTRQESVTGRTRQESESEEIKHLLQGLVNGQKKLEQKFTNELARSTRELMRSQEKFKKDIERSQEKIMRRQDVLAENQKAINDSQQEITDSQRKITESQQGIVRHLDLMYKQYHTGQPVATEMQKWPVPAPYRKYVVPDTCNMFPPDSDKYALLAALLTNDHNHHASFQRKAEIDRMQSAMSTKTPSKVYESEPDETDSDAEAEGETRTNVSLGSPSPPKRRRFRM